MIYVSTQGCFVIFRQMLSRMSSNQFVDRVNHCNCLTTITTNSSIPPFDFMIYSISVVSLSTQTKIKPTFKQRKL